MIAQKVAANAARGKRVSAIACAVVEDEGVKMKTVSAVDAIYHMAASLPHRLPLGITHPPQITGATDVPRDPLADSVSIIRLL